MTSSTLSWKSSDEDTTVLFVQGRGAAECMATSGEPERDSIQPLWRSPKMAAAVQGKILQKAWPRINKLFLFLSSFDSLELFQN